MCSTILTIQPATITTKPLMQAACGDISPVHEKREAEFRPLPMDWVVVTDTNGNRRPEMRWRVN
jgi:hypothetical protein